MPTVYIAIGSNIGNREKNCEQAIKLMEEAGIRIKKRSLMRETKPVGPPQPDYINMAVEAETGLEPLKLLRVLKSIESAMGRAESIRWGPRAIDLDIIFYDSLVMNTEELAIPHLRMHEREFVLRPLSEIAPDFRHPVLMERVSVLLSRAKVR